MERLIETISRLVHEMGEDRRERKERCAVLNAIERLDQRIQESTHIMAATAQQLIDAAKALLTVVTPLAGKIDAIDAAAEAVIAALKGVALPPETQATIDALTAATAEATADSDKLAAETTKLNAALGQ